MHRLMRINCSLDSPVSANQPRLGLILARSILRILKYILRRRSAFALTSANEQTFMSSCIPMLNRRPSLQTLCQGFKTHTHIVSRVKFQFSVVCCFDSTLIILMYVSCCNEDDPRLSHVNFVFACKEHSAQGRSSTKSLILIYYY